MGLSAWNQDDTYRKVPKQTKGLDLFKHHSGREDYEGNASIVRDQINTGGENWLYNILIKGNDSRIMALFVYICG